MTLHYTSTIILDMLNFSSTGDDLMIDVTYKAAAEKSDSKLVITETNINTGKVNQASIGNLYILAFCRLLPPMLRAISRKQTMSEALNLDYDVRVGMSDLSLITGSTDKCIVIHCAHTDFSASQPVTVWESVHLSAVHTTAIVSKTHEILDISRTQLTIPAETATMRFFGVRKPGTLLPWTYHLSKSGVMLNEPFTTIIDRPTVILCSDDEATDSGINNPSHPLPNIRPLQHTVLSSRRTPKPQMDKVIRDESADINLNGASYLDEYEQPRPDTHLVCSYFVFKAYKLTIRTASRGVCDYTDEHGEFAIKHLKRWRPDMIDAINSTLDEAAFVLNKITLEGLTALLESRGPASPYGQAMEYLNNFTPSSYESSTIERGLNALYNFN